MSGAGSATLAFGLESSFTGSVTGGSYYSFGRNPTVQTLSIDNQITRLREAGKIENAAAIKGNFEGAFSVEAVANEETFDEVNSAVFNSSGTGFTTGRANSMQVVAGVEHLSSPSGTNTKVRELAGVIPTDFEVTYNQGSPVRYSMTCLYADEADGSEPSSANLTRPSDSNDAAFHNVDVKIDGTSVSKLQSSTLSFSTLYRYQYGPSPTPKEAVLAAPETTLETEAVYEGADYLEDAYGAAAATTPQDIAHCHGVSDDGITSVWPIDTRNYG
jgi:hypothetical protein